jgi:hypothetical protein
VAVLRGRYFSRALNAKKKGRALASEEMFDRNRNFSRGSLICGFMSGIFVPFYELSGRLEGVE